MAKAHCLVSVNFPFRTLPVAQLHSLAAREALCDYDVVVIRPSSLGQFPGLPADLGDCEGWIEGNEFARVEAIFARKKVEILQLLENGGVLVVILDALETLRWNPYAQGHSHLGGVHSVTNYDFLDREICSCIHNGPGGPLAIVDADEPFANVLQNSSVHSTASIGPPLPCPFDNPRVFARNGESSIVGAALECGRGHLVFLPNFDSLDEKAFITACMEYRFEREAINQPAWLRSVFLPGEIEANNALTAIQIEMKRLERRRMAELERREQLLEFKNLLYEAERHRLANAVRRALIELGFRPATKDPIPGSLIQFDAGSNGGSSPALLRVAGSNGQITYSEFAAFAEMLARTTECAGSPHKAIFVGNGFCQSSPSSRLGTSVFSAKVLEGAKEYSVALVNSVELYSVVCGVLSRKQSDLGAIRETILGTSGYVDLKIFCDNPSFSIDLSPGNPLS